MPADSRTPRSSSSLVSPSSAAPSWCRCGCGGRKWPRRLLVCLAVGYACWFALLMVAHAVTGDLVSGWIRFCTSVDVRTWTFVVFGSFVGALITLAPSYYLIRKAPTLESLIDGNVHSVADSDETTFAEVCVEALTHLPAATRSLGPRATASTGVPPGARHLLRDDDDGGGGASPIDAIYPAPSAPPLPSVGSLPTGECRAHQQQEIRPSRVPDQKRVMQPTL
ncbi:hypothetical protein FOL46_004441 [Perkinsus olseni]|uniref:Uncharacterized protein n=1 Tax=Perkinsus olseni TaxID=32597 RepID=A0A7J6LXR7_PEROL|nr:hypothetical protein FOL46_004441 [Perkinsus olseni]